MSPFEKMFYVMKKPWVMGLYVLLIILVYQFADKTIALYFNHHDVRAHIPALSVLTMFGKWQIYILLFLMAGLYFHYISKNRLFEKRAWFLLSCVLFANIIGAVIKITVSRARPDLLINEGIFGFFWFKLNDSYWSFPSGHTLTVISLAAGLGVIFARYFYVLLSLALLVVLSRVLLYFHFLSDVMTGFYLSILIVGFFAEYLKKNYDFSKAIIF